MGDTIKTFLEVNKNNINVVVLVYFCRSVIQVMSIGKAKNQRVGSISFLFRLR